MLKWFSVLAALAATSAVAQGGPSFPIKGYPACTQPIQSFCGATVSPTVNRPAMQQCLKGHFEELPIACKENVRDHVWTAADCQGHGGESIDSPTCPTGQTCKFTHADNPHPNRCITDP